MIFVAISRSMWIVPVSDAASLQTYEYLSYKPMLKYAYARSTDLLIASGHLPSPYPCTVGHEGAGRVIKAGKNVTRTKVGDEVLLSFSYCQSCKTCEAGHPAGCTVSARAGDSIPDNNKGTQTNATI